MGVAHKEPPDGKLIFRLYVLDNGALSCCGDSDLRQPAKAGSSQNWKERINQWEDLQVPEVRACPRVVSGTGCSNAAEEEPVGLADLQM